MAGGGKEKRSGDLFLQWGGEGDGFSGRMGLERRRQVARSSKDKNRGVSFWLRRFTWEKKIYAERGAEAPRQKILA